MNFGKEIQDIKDNNDVLPQRQTCDQDKENSIYLKDINECQENLKNSPMLHNELLKTEHSKQLKIFENDERQKGV